MRAGVEETRMVETVAEFDGIRLNWAVGMSMTFKGDGKRLRKSSVCFQTYLHPSIHPSTSPRIRSNRSTLVLPRSIHSFLRSLLSSSLLFSSLLSSLLFSRLFFSFRRQCDPPASSFSLLFIGADGSLGV